MCHLSKIRFRAYSLFFFLILLFFSSVSFSQDLCDQYIEDYLPKLSQKMVTNLVKRIDTLPLPFSKESIFEIADYFIEYYLKDDEKKRIALSLIEKLFFYRDNTFFVNELTKLFEILSIQNESFQQSLQDALFAFLYSNQIGLAQERHLAITEALYEAHVLKRSDRRIIRRIWKN